MKYENLIKTIEGVFDGLTMGEQTELISLSPILNAIYNKGAKDALTFVEHEVDKKGLYSKYAQPLGYEVEGLNFYGEEAYNDFVNEKLNN